MAARPIARLSSALSLRRALRGHRDRDFSTSPPPSSAARSGVYTVPNALTLARMVVLAPLAGHLILAGDYAAAAAAVAAAGALDALDGFVARRFDQRSALGAYLDPAADKALLVTCALCLGQQGVLPAWLVALFVARDAGLVGGALLLRVRTRPAGAPFLPTAAEQQGLAAAAAAAAAGADGGAVAPPREWQVAPSRISKINTALQFLVVCCGLTSAAFALPPPPREDAAAMLRWRWRSGELRDDGGACDGGGARDGGDVRDGGGVRDGAIVRDGAGTRDGGGAVDGGGAREGTDAHVGEVSPPKSQGPTVGAATAAATAAAAAPPALASEPARLLLPALVVAVGATTLASGADYFVKALRVLRAVRV